MTVKGFIMEDDRGQEFVVVCEKPSGRPEKVFALKGWQRRRMVPLQWTGQELRHITGGVLVTLNDLRQTLVTVREDVSAKQSHSSN